MTAGSARVELTEHTLTIDPRPAASIAGRAALVARTADSRLRFKVCSQSSSVTERNPPVRAGAPPTLLTRMSTRPAAAATSSAGPSG